MVMGMGMGTDRTGRAFAIWNRPTRGGRLAAALALVVCLAGLAGCGDPAVDPSLSAEQKDTTMDAEHARLAAENLDLKMRLAEAQAQQLPTVNVRRTLTPPKIDGDLSDRAWDSAEEVRFDLNPWAEGAARREPSTRVRVLYDQEFLYVRFVVESETWVAAETERDGKVYLDERVEVFLDADERDDFYHCVEVNPLGTIEDYACEFYRGYQLAWSPTGLLAAGKPWVDHGRTLGYVVEVRVPWAGITAKVNEAGKVIKEKEVPFIVKSGAVLGAGFYRIHIVPDGPNVKESYSLWRPPWSPIPDYHLTSTFGKMVLE